MQEGEDWGSRRAISGSTLWQWAATGVDTTPSFILAEYDLDLRILGACCEGRKSAEKVLIKHTRSQPSKSKQTCSKSPSCTRPRYEVDVVFTEVVILVVPRSEDNTRQTPGIQPEVTNFKPPKLSQR